jgi:hypothetical protein
VEAEGFERVMVLRVSHEVRAALAMASRHEAVAGARIAFEVERVADADRVRVGGTKRERRPFLAQNVVLTVMPMLIG